jgi:cupin fold WbuC family metalloprotein
VSAVLRPEGDVVVLDRPMMQRLEAMAKADPDGRARICLHPDDDAPVQQMIIAFTRQSELRPHRHHDKHESYTVLAGELDLVLYDDDGNEVQRLHLCAHHPDKPRMVQLRGSCFHTVVPRSEIVVILEVTNGPFDRAKTEFAEWQVGGSG